MILDRVENLRQYLAIHPAFAQAASFLDRPDLATLPPGRVAIDGETVFALISDANGRGMENSPLEIHRRYIDIQLPLAGADVIGWRGLADCHSATGPYDPAKDIQFFSDLPATWLTLAPGMFAVFFPADAHAPLAGREKVRKIVLKVAVNISHGGVVS
jgi:YhcH/YjgK/YiaL family protein